MDGTTLCPHCNTRFRIAGEQLEAHQGMVRCGHCLQPFDARPGFIPDQPDPQLELPIVDQAIPHPATSPEVSDMEPDAESVLVIAPEAVADVGAIAQTESPDVANEPPHDASLDFVQPVVAEATPEATPPPRQLVIQPLPLIAMAPDEDEESAPHSPKYHRLWIAGATSLALLLCLQGLYFFRIEVASRLPGLKPVVVGYCNLLGCSVPLPQNVDLMSIESSELEADPAHADKITLIAVLRNRASHVQAFPTLELALNDNQDKVLARRLFKPDDYLPDTESTAAGLRPNRETHIRLRLDTADLRPTGYRLVLLYPEQERQE